MRTERKKPYLVGHVRDSALEYICNKSKGKGERRLRNRSVLPFGNMVNKTCIPKKKKKRKNCIHFTQCYGDGRCMNQQPGIGEIGESLDL